jgi:hypothetical protein
MKSLRITCFLCFLAFLVLLGCEVQRGDGEATGAASQAQTLTELRQLPLLPIGLGSGSYQWTTNLSYTVTQSALGGAPLRLELTGLPHSWWLRSVVVRWDGPDSFTSLPSPMPHFLVLAVGANGEIAETIGMADDIAALPSYVVAHDIALDVDHQIDLSCRYMLLFWGDSGDTGGILRSISVSIEQYGMEPLAPLPRRER